MLTFIICFVCRQKVIKNLKQAATGDSNLPSIIFSTITVQILALSPMVRLFGRRVKTEIDDCMVNTQTQVVQKQGDGVIMKQVEIICKFYLFGFVAPF